MAAVAVFMMIMVAFAPMASIFTDDQGADAAPASYDGTVTVTVMDKDGDPVKTGVVISAEFEAQGGVKYTLEATTNSSGVATFNVAAGTSAYDKNVQLEIKDGAGYTFDEQELITIEEEYEGGIISVEMVANEYTLSGIVEVPTATGVKDAVVSYSIDGKLKSVKTIDTSGNYYIPATEGSTVVISGVAKDDVVFNSGLSYTFSSIAANQEVPTITGNVLKFSGEIKDKGGYAIDGSTVKYKINGVSKSVVTEEGGVYSVYVAYGDNVEIVSVTNSNYTFNALSGDDFKRTSMSANFDVDDINAKEITLTVTSMDASSTSAPISGVTIKATTTPSGTKASVISTSNSDGVTKIAVLLSESDSTAVNLIGSKTGYAFAAAGVTETIAVGATEATADVDSTSYVLTGTVGDFDGDNGNLFDELQVVLASSKYDIETKTVDVDANGGFSFVVEKVKSDGAEDSITAKIKGTSTFGFTFPSTGVKEESIDNTTTFELEANEKTMTVSGNVSGTTIDTTDGTLGQINYSVNNNTKTVYTADSAAGDYVILVAKGAAVTGISVDNVTKKLVKADGIELYDNPAYGYGFVPTQISLGSIAVDMGDNDFDGTAKIAVTKEIILTTNTLPTDTKVTAQIKYVDVNGESKIFTETKVAASPVEFTGVDAKLGSSLSYVIAADDYVKVEKTVSSISTTTVVTAESLVTEGIIKFTVTPISNVSTKDLTIEYVVYDGDLGDATPTYDKKTVTDKDGKASVKGISGQRIAFKINDSGIYTFDRAAAASGEAKDLVLGTAADVTIASKQTKAVSGIIKMSETGIVLPGVSVGFEIYKTADARSGVATGAVITDDKGKYVIPVIADANCSIVTYPVLNGYSFGSTDGFKEAKTYFTTALTSGDVTADGIFSLAVAPAVEKVKLSVLSTSLYSVSTVNEALSTDAVDVDVGTELILSAQDYVYEILDNAAGAAGNAVEKLSFKGWYFNGELIEGAGVIATYTVSEAGVFEAQYSASVSDSTPAPGINSTVLIIGIIAVVIALIAVAYVVIQCKKE